MMTSQTNFDWEVAIPPTNRKSSGGVASYLFLFSVILSASFLNIFIPGICFFRNKIDTDNLFMRLILMTLSILLLCSGQIPVSYFRIRNIWAIRGTAFLAALLGINLALWALYEILVDPQMRRGLIELIRAEITGMTIIIFGSILLFCPVLYSEFSVMRARYLFSQKTGRWLRSYTVKKPYTIKAADVDMEAITFDDVMTAERGSRKNNPFTFILFVDYMPEGKHYLCLMRRTKAKFFSTKTGTNIPQKKFLPLDHAQIERFDGKFGPLKKDLFISFFSAAKNFMKIPAS